MRTTPIHASSRLTILALFLTACAAGPAVGGDAEDRAPIAKADQTGSCASKDGNFCGDQSDGNCWCDDNCDFFGDCCADKAYVCDGEEPFCADGEIDAVTRFSPSADDKECASEELHCLSDDCLVVFPPAPGFCPDGELVEGEPNYLLNAADGKECRVPRFHCLTEDLNACPQPAPPVFDFCADGTAVPGPPTFVDSTDGMECRLQTVHCVTNDPDACEGA